MLIARNGHIGICSRRKPIFIDIGGNYNADDFEAWATGSIAIGAVAAFTATDFEQFSGASVISFTNETFGSRNFSDLELLDEGIAYSFAPLTGINATSTGIARSSTNYSYGFFSFETLPETTVTTLPALDAPYGATNPTGAFFKIYP